MPKKMQSKYWQQRFDQIEQAANNKSVKYIKQLEKKYNTAAQQLDKQINAWYQRIAVNNEVTITEAKKLLSASELKEFKWTVEDYIEYGQRNAVDQQWMKELENASAKFHISRLEALKLEARQQVEQLFAGGQETMFDTLADVYKDTFYRSCFEVQKGFGVGFDVSKLDDKQISTLLMKPWSVDGTNFSEKLWGNKRKLINTLDQELSRMVLTGESPQKIVTNIRKAMNTSQFAAKRLVLTEQAYFASVAQKDAYAELDVEEFEFVGTLDGRTCEDCGGLDGQHFPLKEMQPGVNAAPMHPYCRCTTAPYFNDEFTVGERIAKDEDGEYYHVPEKMTYTEWKDSFVGHDGDKKDLQEVIDADKIKLDIDSLKVKRQQVIDDIVSKQEQLDMATLNWFNDPSNDDLMNQMTLLQEEFDKLGIERDNITNQIEELMNKLPKDNTIRMNTDIIVNGKDLIGEVDYSDSVFVHDIETAMNAQGFNGVPNVVEYDEFKDIMEKTNFYAERSYSASTQEQLDIYRDELYHGGWYVDCSEGGAQYGQGMYCAATYDLSDGKSLGGIGSEMSHYKVLNKEKGLEYSYTESITLQPGAKIFELPNDVKVEEYVSDRYQFEYLRKHAPKDKINTVEKYIEACEDIEKNPTIYELYNIRDVLAQEIGSDLMRSAMDSLMYKTSDMKYGKMKNPSTLLVEMGYDAVNAVGHGESGSYTVILNRTKVIFCKGGSIYGN